LNLLHVSSCKMLTFCDVLHETTKSVNKLLRVHGTNWKSSLRWGEHHVLVETGEGKDLTIC